MRAVVAGVFLTVVQAALASPDLQSPPEAGKSPGSSGDPAIVELIKNLENERLQAGVRKDVEAVAAATSDRYMQIDLDGRVLDKAATLQRIRSNFARLTSNRVSEVVVRVFGDTAVLTALGAPRGTVDGKEVGAIRYTRVYAKEQDGRWRVVLFHQTRVVPERP